MRAVTAAVQGGAEGNIERIMDEIKHAVEKAEKTGKNGSALIEEAVNENMKLVIENILNRSQVTKELVEEGKLEIVSAKYFLDTGEVKLVDTVNATSLANSTALAGVMTPAKGIVGHSGAILAMTGILSCIAIASVLQRIRKRGKRDNKVAETRV